MKDLRQQWNTRYASGDTPWDSGVTPPEVISYVANEQLGVGELALDLGCGTGTNVAWLARRGLRAIGVEHAGNALHRAHVRRLALDPAVRERVILVQGDAACLPFTGLGAAYILDIGCLHGLPPGSRPAYANGVIDNLARGGTYHLFAFDRPDESAVEPEMRWRGMGNDEVAALFTPALAMVSEVRGDPDHLPCRWYLLRKAG